MTSLMTDTVSGVYSSKESLREMFITSADYYLSWQMATTVQLLKHLGSQTCGEPGDIAETDISRLNKLLTGSKHFVDLWESSD